MRCHSHLPSWYTFTYTHIPGTGMAAVEEAALGKSWVCRWCAGVSAAGAGVWKNPDGTMAAISYVVTSVVCHSPSAALVGTPITSLHFTHYRPPALQTCQNKPLAFTERHLFHIVITQIWIHMNMNHLSYLSTTSCRGDISIQNTPYKLQ